MMKKLGKLLCALLCATLIWAASAGAGTACTPGEAVARVSAIAAARNHCRRYPTDFLPVISIIPHPNCNEHHRTIILSGAIAAHAAKSPVCRQ